MCVWGGEKESKLELASLIFVLSPSPLSLHRLSLRRRCLFASQRPHYEPGGHGRVFFLNAVPLLRAYGFDTQVVDTSAEAAFAQPSVCMNK